MERKIFEFCVSCIFGGIFLPVLPGNLPVIPQVILAPEGFPADIARVGPLIGVRSLVNEKIVTFCEMTRTIFTYELFS